MARLLDRATFVNLTGNAAYADSTQYADARLSAVFSAVDAMVSRYLQFVPYLALTSNEEGIVSYLEAGDYAGRYLLHLKNRPLVPGTPTQIFTSLQLLYAPTTIPSGTVDLTYVQVDHATSRVLALGAGLIDALVGIGFQQAPTRGLRAVSFLASYWAGALTGVNDPSPPTGVTPDPIPTDLQMAAALLAVEMLQMQAAQTAQGSSASATVPAGMVVSERRVGERAEVYRPIGSASSATATLGLGSALSVTAANLLAPYKRVPAPVLV